jgi:hypothetical protein
LPFAIIARSLSDAGIVVELPVSGPISVSNADASAGFLSPSTTTGGGAAERVPLLQQRQTLVRAAEVTPPGCARLCP